ncbi:helix-turn-helix domain-containing protein [Cohnella terricola]|uniref:helix-turn-helix domain-containing protein n=1 Tax=Cohnella terricola TaxID=1289167 RepID=UPI0016441754|nr:AraC family transcriptional regulator [Cohnella terricola]
MASWCDWAGSDPLPIAPGERSCVLWLRAGSGHACSVHNRIEINAGACLFVPPEVEVTLRPVADLPIRAVAYFVSGLQVQGKRRGMLANSSVPFLIPPAPDQHKVDRIMEDILHEIRHPQLGSSEVVSSLLQALLIHFLRELRDEEALTQPSSDVPSDPQSEPSGEDETTVGLAHHVRVYIEKNFHLELSLSDLAQIVFVSPYHLAHIFKEEVGMSPIQYLIKCRIDEAKRMLVETGYSVREIASRVGYPNANYFNLLFSKMTGDSPGKYRKRK